MAVCIERRQNLPKILASGHFKFKWYKEPKFILCESSLKHCEFSLSLFDYTTAWKVSVLGVILVRIFPALGLNTEIYSNTDSFYAVHPFVFKSKISVGEGRCFHNTVKHLSWSFGKSIQWVSANKYFQKNLNLICLTGTLKTCSESPIENQNFNYKQTS